jgi:hypothetical protein
LRGQNATWRYLAALLTPKPSTASGQVHRLDDGIWMFGGPASMTQYVDALVAALTK